MAAGNRSFSDVFQDIVRNFQESVRSEVRLAKTEIREEAVKVKSSAILLGGSVVTGLFAILFFLLMITYALVLVMPKWAASLVVEPGQWRLASRSRSALSCSIRFTRQPNEQLKPLRRTSNGRSKKPNR